MGIKTKIIAALLSALTIASLIGWAHYERQAKEAAQERLGAAQAQLEQSEAAREFEQMQQAAVAAIDKAQTERLRDAQAEIDDLRGRVAAGAIELRVDAECPDRDAMPGAADSAGVGDGAGARLDEDARPAYYTHREGIERIERQLDACQRILGVFQRRYGAD